MIGVFDSGLGGLTVLSEIKKKLPEYSYLYYGDTLHVPYGPRSDEAIYELSKKACDFLFEKGCKLIIVACNTASAKGLRRLQTEYLVEKRKESNNLKEQINILGVIRPVVEEVVGISKGRIGVIGTKGTVESGIYKEECKVEREKIKVIQTATPMLVPFIEEGLAGRKELKSILRYYLRDLKRETVDTLILGCTHYPLIIRQIRGIMGKNCFVPNPAEIVARKFEEYLRKHGEIESVLDKGKDTEYFVTDVNDNFRRMAGRFLGKRIELEKV
jgi:glutamate racemase